MSGRPPLSIGTYGTISTQKRGISWRASCLFRDSDGITRPIERNRKTKADAERALKVAIRDHETAARVGELSGESTIAQLMEVFWAWKLATKKLAAGSKTNYADVITRIIVPGLGAIRLREATTGRLDTWYLRERETRRAQAELAKTLLNQAFKLAARRDALPYNPMSGLSVPDEDRTPVRALTDQELETMRNAVRTMRQNTWLPDIFETQYTLGLRIGEVLALTVDDLDLHNEDGPIVHINSTVITPTGKPERQPHTKDGPAGRRPVVAPLPPGRSGYCSPAATEHCSTHTTSANPGGTSAPKSDWNGSPRTTSEKPQPHAWKQCSAKRSPPSSSDTNPSTSPASTTSPPSRKSHPTCEERSRRGTAEAAPVFTQWPRQGSTWPHCTHPVMNSDWAHNP
jgi:integrase